MNDLKWCIDYLNKYNNNYFSVVSYDFDSLRGLMNITMPINLSIEYYQKQDKVLKDILSRKEIVDISKFKKGINLYKGGIKLIKADAIVNSCNSKMLGCFVIGHQCIDNAIHSFAGLQVRKDMMEIMSRLNHDEEKGNCKVTLGYNLPSKCIFHTLGPIYSNIKQDEIDLRNCYYSCLKQADELNLESIVFCSISTGVFGYPISKASEIAISSVNSYLKTKNKSIKKVIFDVYSKQDYDIYKDSIKRLVK